MKLHRMYIEGYKRIEAATILFGDATFLIGPNNTGKSSTLGAISHLLSGNKRIPEVEYYSVEDEATNERKTVSNKIVLEAEFRNLPVESKTWRGFKGRVFEYDPEASGESGLYLTYRKTYELGKDVVIELKSKTRTMKPEFEKLTTPQEFIEKGISEELVRELYDDMGKKLTAATKTKLEEINDIWDLGAEDTWFQNPGGIPGIVLCRLPRYIIIPADTSSGEMTSGGVLPKTLNELFEDVRATSHNYKEAQHFLNALAKELDPSDASSEFGKMIAELNKIISNVFPESKLHAKADLSDPDKSLKPSFTVELSSNIRTPVDHQGAGMIRSAVFGILRFRQKWLSMREDQGIKRALLIGFEEPEICLHPSAANQMRDTIYELSSEESQIVATTHSPFLIDLARKPKQVLNRFAFATGGAIQVQPFSVTDAFNKLQNEDRDYIKMILKVDDYVARVFFTKRIVVVEGDTEDIVIRETLSRVEKSRRQALMANTEMIKARGKASIIGLAKYLKALGIAPFVIHDRDGNTAGAEKYNAPIEEIVGKENIIQLEECLEDVLGYDPPSSEKPFKAYSYAKSWGDSWTDVPEGWRKIMEKAFEI